MVINEEKISAYMDEPSKCFAERTKPDIKCYMLDDLLV